MESKYADIKVFILFIYSINLSSLIFSLFFHNRESKQPDQSFSNTKALGDWRRLVSGCSFWRPERASLLVSCFLWWVFTSVRHVRITAVLVMIHWDATPAMRTETGNAWRDGRETTVLTVSTTCVCQMLRGLFSRFGIVCLGLWKEAVPLPFLISLYLCLIVVCVCWNLRSSGSNTSPYLSYLCVHVCRMEAELLL